MPKKCINSELLTYDNTIIVLVIDYSYSSNQQALFF